MNQNDKDLYRDERYRGEQNQGVESIGRYTAKTFFWMFLGLLTTFLVAAVGTATKAVYIIHSISALPMVLLVLELAVVLFLSAKIRSLSVGVARALFFLYAVLNGIMFVTFFVYYDLESLLLVFAVTALYFGGLAAYGYLTHTDLSRLRPILSGGLIFLILFGVISMFIDVGMLERIYCLVGIAIFLGFTAYDTQKIRACYNAYAGDPVMLKKASIFSALQLYLDFINLFLYLLRFLGKRK